VGLLLIWIESLAAGLLLVACVLAWTSHFRWRISQAALPVIIALGLAMQAGLIAGFAAIARSRAAMQPDTYWYFISWSVTLGVGLLVVIHRGLMPRKSRSPLQERSKTRSISALLSLTVVRISLVVMVVSTALGALAFLGTPKLGAIANLNDFLDWRFYVYIAGWALVLGIMLAISLTSHRKASEEEIFPLGRSWPRNRLLVSLLVAITLTGLTFLSMDSAIKTQLAGMRAESGPRILALIPPRVPDPDNAALIYQQAFDRLPSRGQSAAQFWEKVTACLDSTKPINIQDKELAEMLQSQQPAINLLRQAAAKPECYFERNWFDGNETLPELQ
jgi:hypothetical protein